VYHFKIAEHPGIYHREATERRCVGRALQPAGVAAQLHRLPLQAQGPQRRRQPAPLPARNHRGMPVIIVPSVSVLHDFLAIACHHARANN
jgi:hypothetical protein